MPPEEVRDRIRGLAEQLTAVLGRTDPIVEACVACLEAADSVCDAMTRRPDAAALVADEYRKALHATRAATLAIRAAISLESDRCRIAHAEEAE
ncbi:hypothetical protein [Saccharopolyspora sp. NPDC002578]